MLSPEELLRGAEPLGKLRDSVTLLMDQGHLEAAAILAIVINDPRGPSLEEVAKFCEEVS